MAQQQSRAVRTREVLIESAAQTFDEQGFARASLSAISARAGVSNGALHHHFASKAALARAVAAAAEGRLTRITAPRPLSAGGGSLQFLIDATHGLVQALAEDVVLRVGFGATPHTGPLRGAGRLAPAVGRAGWRRRWSGARREGALRQDAPAETVTATLVALTLGLGALEREASARRADVVTLVWSLLLPPALVAHGRAPLVPSGTPDRGAPPPPAGWTGARFTRWARLTRRAGLTRRVRLHPMGERIPPGAHRPVPGVQRAQGLGARDGRQQQPPERGQRRGRQPGGVLPPQQPRTPWWPRRCRRPPRRARSPRSAAPLEGLRQQPAPAPLPLLV
ncbi:TetR family transcriptional regulator [Streptomyces sp. MMBL 11-3]|uniref:TetR family transcriptional regulator n=1 Tax=Streptomyces sp. MMBL 11-3 TaxID=3382639 RepID=UPI0039B5030A